MTFLKEIFSNRTQFLMLLLLAPLMFFTSCKDDDAPPTTTIVDIAAGNANFSLLVEAVTRAGLVTALSNDNASLTVFAPTNAAFEAAGLNSATIATTPVADLAAILQYHVIGSELRAADITSGTQNTLLTSNSLIYINKSSAGAVKINGAVNVVTPDIDASNGVIHAVDAVIFPPKSIAQTATDAEFSYLVAALTRSGLDLSALSGPLTVFAPTNQAFIVAGFPTIASINAAPAADVAAILSYHVVTGGRTFSSDLASDISVAAASGNRLYFGIGTTGAFVNEAQITGTDILAMGGVIHIVDRVIGTGTIAAFATRNPEFSSLLAGLGAAATTPVNLVTALSNAQGTFTVFAPKNSAFTAFLAGTNITSLDAGLLNTVISYHALNSVVFAADITNGAMPATIQGNAITLNLTQGGVTVTDQAGNTPRNVTTANIKLANGVVHVINGVLDPRD
jgi:transforming growth factor-beta-induced protein